MKVCGLGCLYEQKEEESEPVVGLPAAASLLLFLIG